MDRRLTPATPRIAHVSLKGSLAAPAYCEGRMQRLSRPITDLVSQPGGARDRQLLLGDGFCVIDHDQGHAFGFAEKDGYCGWLPQDALADDPPPTHWICAPASHLYPAPRVQARELADLPMGARLHVIAADAKWSETAAGFVPTPHLRALGDWEADPVAVAERLLGSPYLWGGNTRAGIDCSGLVQLSYHACGLPCPGDSDLQQRLGRPVTDGTAQRGDLLFWRGHVALVSDPDTLLHANGQTMSVAHEPIKTAIDRIATQGGGPVTHRRRP